MRTQHPAEYNADLQRESRSARRAWTEDEENELALSEARYEGDDIINHLLSISSRPKEGIRGRRKLQRYKDKVAAYRRDTAQPLAEAQAHSETERAISLKNDKLKEAITTIDGTNLSEIDIKFRNSLISETKDVAVLAMETWFECFLNHHCRRKPPSSNQVRRPNPVDVVVGKLCQPEGGFSVKFC